MNESEPIHVKVSQDKQDILGTDYRARVLELGGGKICTLINYAPVPKQDKIHTAILYLHGYTDYFFQTGLAEYFSALGYRFYAIDLQGYGRSIRANQTLNSCKSLLDYHSDIASALAVMAKEGITSCIPLAHSTGGLIIASYLRVHLAKHLKPHTENSGIHIKGLILNSPFLSVPISPQKETIVLPIYRFLTKYLPFISINTHRITYYTQSLHKRLSGEWDYRLDWKPASGLPLSFYWLGKIMEEQALCVQTKIPIPTLLCRSGKSTYLAKSLDECRHGDGVLNIENMELKAKLIFPNLVSKVIENGFHDLYLSPQPVREKYLSAVQTWLESEFA